MLWSDIGYVTFRQGLMLTIFEFMGMISLCGSIVFSVSIVISFSDVLGFD